MFDHTDQSVKVFLALFGALALFLCAVMYWVLPVVSSEIARKRQEKEKAKEQKVKYAKALVDLEDACEKREGWLDRAVDFSWNMRGKKFTKRQRTKREALRQQGLLFVEEEIDIRKFLYDQKGDSHHRTMVQVLYRLREQLADEHQHSWLKEFYKS